MHPDHTQPQTPLEQQRAQELSLRRAKPPAEIPGCDIQRFLGAGAYGEVWVGADRNTGRSVAVKYYGHRGGVTWSLLEREVEKLVQLSADRYVVQLLEVGWEADPPYYVMEFIENGSLGDLLARRGALPVDEALELFEEIATGLVHAHGKGVLHCDLKPANILLDEDHKPRLADFGQSRSAQEKTPALGTLFYMAPEQADLQAAPDARWDVYALGALLYCMLTGSPPHRTSEIVEELETADSLSDRLSRYRRAIAAAPPLTEHRKRRGVDRALADIIDRCLDANPRKRYANAQEVVDALRARRQWRSRRPVLLFGLVGPMLLMLTMAYFGWRGYSRTMDESRAAVSQRALENNRLSAELAARLMEAEISDYFRALEKEAASGDLRALIASFDDQRLQKLADLNLPPDEAENLREQHVQSQEHARLKGYLQKRLQSYLDRTALDPRAPKFSSAYVVHSSGIILSVAYDNPGIESKSEGYSYAHRTYFHGGSTDLPVETRAGDVQMIASTHLSAVFRSTSTRTWKIAISTPIDSGQQSSGEADQPAGGAAGVLVFTVELGDFAFVRSTPKDLLDRFVVLIDGREGETRGTVLQHPANVDLTRNKYQVSPEALQRLRQGPQYDYRDPLAAAEGGDRFGGAWIAAVESVRLPETALGDGRKRDSNLLVLVQESVAAVTDPIRRLGGGLLDDGLWALAVVLFVIFALWFLVLRVLGDPRSSVRPEVDTATEPSPLHNRPTVAISRNPGR